MSNLRASWMSNQAKTMVKTGLKFCQEARVLAKCLFSTCSVQSPTIMKYSNVVECTVGHDYVLVLLTVQYFPFFYILRSLGHLIPKCNHCFIICYDYGNLLSTHPFQGKEFFQGHFNFSLSQRTQNKNMSCTRG